MGWRGQSAWLIDCVFVSLLCAFHIQSAAHSKVDQHTSTMNGSVRDRESSSLPPTFCVNASWVFVFISKDLLPPTNQWAHLQHAFTLVLSTPHQLACPINRKFVPSTLSMPFRRWWSLREKASAQRCKCLRPPLAPPLRRNTPPTTQQFAAQVRAEKIGFSTLTEKLANLCLLLQNRKSYLLSASHITSLPSCLIWQW